VTRPSTPPPSDPQSAALEDGVRFTKGEWLFERMGSVVKIAALTGERLEEHEGYARDNNGDWIVTFRNEDDSGRIAAVSFKGTAKRGQAYGAPDPEGMANAHLIAAAPDMFEALDGVHSFLMSAPIESGICCCGDRVEDHNMGSGHSPVDELSYAAAGYVEKIDAALSKALGEQVRDILNEGEG